MTSHLIVIFPFGSNGSYASVNQQPLLQIREPNIHRKKR